MSDRAKTPLRSFSKPTLPQEEQIVFDHYKILHQLGKGSFGTVFSGINLETNEKVAIKTEQVSDKTHCMLLEAEATKLNKLQNHKGIPKLHFFGKTEKKNILVMELLGRTLNELFVHCNKKFTLLTVCLLGCEMLKLIEFIHEKTFIHRDIKPDNFMMGKDEKEDVLYLIDFGLSKRYISTKGVHIPYKTGKSMTGTARYCSVFTHEGIEQSRRDDLESIGYVLIYFLKGSLPWQGIKIKEGDKHYEKIGTVKKNTSIDELCKGFPDEFKTYFNYVKNLKFEEAPNYNLLNDLFQRMLMKYSSKEYKILIVNHKSKGKLFDWKNPNTIHNNNNNNNNNNSNSTNAILNNVNNPKLTINFTPNDINNGKNSKVDNIQFCFNKKAQKVSKISLLSSVISKYMGSQRAQGNESLFSIGSDNKINILNTRSKKRKKTKQSTLGGGNKNRLSLQGNNNNGLKNSIIKEKHSLKDINSGGNSNCFCASGVLNVSGIHNKDHVSSFKDNKESLYNININKTDNDDDIIRSSNAVNNNNNNNIEGIKSKRSSTTNNKNNLATHTMMNTGNESHNNDSHSFMKSANIKHGEVSNSNSNSKNTKEKNKEKSKKRNKSQDINTRNKNVYCQCTLF